MNPQFATLTIESAAATFAVGRLIYLRLTHRFPALFAFLTLLALSAGLFAVTPTGSPLYFWTYVAYLPLRSVLSVLAVRELFALVFEDYPGIQTIGRWAMYSGIVLSGAASVAITGIFWRGGAGNDDVVLFYLEIVQRSVVFCLAVVIATILFALSRYPLHLDRNAFLSTVFFSFVFLSEAIQLLIDSLTPNLYNRDVDWPECVVSAALLSVWAALLGREPSPRVSRVRFSILGEKRLMEQLESLNVFLGRAGRR